MIEIAPGAARKITARDMAAGDMATRDMRVPATDRGRSTVTPLVACMILSLAAAMIVLACVITGVSDAFDIRVFSLAHGLDTTRARLTPAWLSEAVRDITALGSTVVLASAVVCVAGFLMATDRRRLAGLLVSSAVLATLFSTVMKLGMDRARPALVDPMVVTYTASFPSGHALLSAAIILTMAGLLSRAVDRPAGRRVIVVAAVTMTVCVGLSRIYLGVHWPTDVLAGWCLGVFWSSGTLLAARRLGRATGTPAR